MHRDPCDGDAGAPLSGRAGGLPSHCELMHPRNRFHEGYDFARLVVRLPALAAFVKPSGYGALTIDFANPAAVKALNQALLLEAYGIADWDIPAGYLCPPVPGRSDYVHHVADLLADGDEVNCCGSWVAFL